MSKFSLKYLQLVRHTMTELHCCITTLFIVAHLNFFVTILSNGSMNYLSVGLVLDHNLLSSGFLFMVNRENVIYNYIFVCFKYIESCMYSSIRVETLFFKSLVNKFKS